MNDFENQPERAIPSHDVSDNERYETFEIAIDGFSGLPAGGKSDFALFKDELEGVPGTTKRVPVDEQSVVQKTFDGARQLLSKASSQIPDENGLSYVGDEGVVEHPFHMEAMVHLNDMSVVRKACINALATNTVRLGYRIKKTTAMAGEKDADDVSEQIIDELEGYAEADDSSFTELLYKVKFDEETCGNGYIEVVRDQEGFIAEFHYIPGRTIWIKRDRSGFVQRVGSKEQGFYNFGDVWTIHPDGSRTLNENRDQTTNELIHFKLHNASSSYYGVPRDVAAFTTMYGDELARQNNIKFFTHSATPDLLFIFEVDKQLAGGRAGAPHTTPKVSISETMKKNIENHFRRTLTGSTLTPGIFHLPPGVTLRVERLNDNQKDAGWTDYRKENRAEVQIAFQTPGVIIANTADGSNYATSMQEKSLYLESMVQPEQMRYQDRLMAKLWPEFTHVNPPETPMEIDAEGNESRPASVDIRPKTGTGVNRHIWKLDFTRMTIADAATLAQIHNIYGTLQAITLDEIRADIGKKSMPGGDKPPQPKGGEEGNALAQNADMAQVAAGNPDADSFVSNLAAHPEDITGLQGRPGGGRGSNGTVSVPPPKRVFDKSRPQAANLFSAGHPVAKSDDTDEIVVVSSAAYEFMQNEMLELRNRLEKAESAPPTDPTPDLG